MRDGCTGAVVWVRDGCTGAIIEWVRDGCTGPGSDCQNFSPHRCVARSGAWQQGVSGTQP
eukprot:6494372-Pyramimonas_sp.AAC.2